MPSKYLEAQRYCAVRMVLDHLNEYSSLTAACLSVAAKTGIGKESLRRWVLQAQIDASQRDGVTSSESEQIKVLKKEDRELKDANEILRQASIFFAGELDPRSH